MAEEVHWNTSEGEHPLPAVARPSQGKADLAAWALRHGEIIAERLTAHGAILFRGFDIREQADFEAFVDAVVAQRLDYVYRSTPRTSVGERVFTATEYPRQATIPLHCENAYQRAWPMQLLLYCAEPASRGGETSLADNARVTERIGDEIVEEFAARQVMYVRNYGSDVDLPWQTVFQTERREDVERFCEESGIQFEWKGAKGLRTSQVCQGVATHPETGRRLWFNQAHLFHVSGLDAETRAAMLSIFAENELPRNAYFGDGGPIPVEVLEHIREVYRLETVARPWERGDVMLIDNMLVAHGRMPYEGPRKVLVSMGDALRVSGWI